MDWSNERYVRLYTRDTVDWLALSWQARALFAMLLRKVDRAGVIDLGRHGVKGLAVAVGMPTDVVGPALAELLEDGCIEQHGTRLVMPNFLDAQEAAQSDAQRARESRANRRDRSRVTKPDAGVTDRDETVTPSHGASHAVTPSVPSDPSDPAEGERAPAREAPPPSCVALKVTSGLRQLTTDEPLTPARRAEVDKLAMNCGAKLDAAVVWADFVDHQIVKANMFANDDAIDAAWRRWIRRQETFAKERRIELADRSRTTAAEAAAPVTYVDATPQVRKVEAWAAAAATHDEARAGSAGVLAALGGGAR